MWYGVGHLNVSASPYTIFVSRVNEAVGKHAAFDATMGWFQSISRFPSCGRHLLQGAETKDGHVLMLILAGLSECLKRVFRLLSMTVIWVAHFYFA
jgi:hypothetical protein